MPTFSTKALRGQGTLGERLRKTREARGIELSQVAEDLSIQEKYLAAIEAGEYLKLPGDVYVKNFLKKYAEYLDVNPTTALYLYEHEGVVFAPQRQKYAREVLEKEKRLPKEILTPRGIRAVFIALGVLLILVYLGVEIQRIVRPPDLEILSPDDNIKVVERTIVIQGQTEPEAIVSVNNEEVVPNEDGSFEETVELIEGLNTIVITAKKARSNERKVVRNILVEITPNQ